MTYPEITDPDEKQNIQGALEDQSRARSAIDAIQGREFSNGHLFEDVPDDETVGILFELPIESECYAFLDSFFATTGEAYVRKVDQVTKDSAGTITPENNRLISNGESCATVEYGASVSGGNEWTPKVIGSLSDGFFSQPLAPGTADGPAIIVQPGENVYYEATNVSEQPIEISIDVDWTEIPLEEIPEL
jgi:hypothetical protein